MFLGLVSAPLNPPFEALGKPPSTFLIKLDHLQQVCHLYHQSNLGFQQHELVYHECESGIDVVGM